MDGGVLDHGAPASAAHAGSKAARVSEGAGAWKVTQEPAIALHAAYPERPAALPAAALRR